MEEKRMDEKRKEKTNLKEMESIYQERRHKTGKGEINA
jgi:hypothetical protein